MKVIAVVGSASGSGKTRLACAILRAIRGLGAVKISPRPGAVRVEWGPGAAGSDTSRFAESGAAAVARIVAPRERAAQLWKAMRPRFELLPGIVVEGAGALGLPEKRYTVFVVAPGTLGERPGRDARLAAEADCILVVRGGRECGADHPIVEHQRERIPVLTVPPEQEHWDVQSLLDDIRMFLGASARNGSTGPACSGARRA